MSDSSPNVLIVGGGVAGLSAADYLSACGMPVHLVEKADRLGGKARDWACMATDSCRHCGACLSAELAVRVGQLENVAVSLESSLTGLTRKNGRFKATVSGKAAADLEVDAVLVATGMSLYDPAQQKDLGYGIYPNVITTGELNAILQEERLTERLGGVEQPAVAFIQCVGSRNREKGRDYCSRICCKNAIRQAGKIQHLIPDAAVTIFNIDLQATGKAFRSQVEAAASRIELVQGTPAKILDTVEAGKLTLFQESGPAGRRARHFDLVVLSVGILPAPETGEIAAMAGIPTDTWGFLGNGDTALPEGVFAAGVTRGPTNILDAIGQGKSAAHQIALFLGYAPEKEETPIAVFGGDAAARQVAAALAERGHPAILIAVGDLTPAGEAGFTTCPGARLTRVEGTAGNYTLHTDSPDGPQTITAGAIVIASQPHRRPPADIAWIDDSLMTLTDFMARCEQKETLPENILFWLDHNGPERKECVRQIMQTVPDLVADDCKVTLLMEKMLVNYPNGQQCYDKVRGLGVKLLRVTGQQAVTLRPDGNRVVLEIEEATLPEVTLTVTSDLVVIPEIVDISDNAREIARQLRQPLDVEGFLQSANVRHRNVGSPRRGIYFAGHSHAEADLDTEIDEIAAALQLPQVTPDEITDQPAINTDQCIRCLTCVRVCPHAAIVLTNHYQPEIVPSACYGCELCVSNCPALAIVSSPFPDTGSAQTVVFACERSAGLVAPDIDLPGETAVISVPCACSVDESRLLQTLAGGANQVIVAACHAGNCRSMKGPAYAKAGTQKLVETLEVPAARISSIHIAANERVRLEQKIKQAALAGEDE